MIVLELIGMSKAIYQLEENRTLDIQSGSARLDVE